MSRNLKFFNDKDTTKALNRLCREQLKLSILKDLSADLVVCKLEGWNMQDFPNELKELIDDICNKFKKTN